MDRFYERSDPAAPGNSARSQVPQIDMSGKIFIDGEAGTTGLGIVARLRAQPEIELLSLPSQARKDLEAKKSVMAEADVVVLCLPDDAARESVALAASLGAGAPRILDASTAHRVAAGWIYGFPELVAGHAEAIRQAKLVANPGCYATGAIALLRPLVDAGLVPPDFPIAIAAVSGYSGGGKTMIAAYENNEAPAFETYGLDLGHKHVPEIQCFSRLDKRPIFVPSVGNFAQGMLVGVPLFLDGLPGKPRAGDLEAVLTEHYESGGSVVVVSAEGAPVRIEPQGLNGTDLVELRVYANETHRQAVLVARLDNLGKGASGAAVQNLRLMLQAGSRENS
jgi:N-acetyl-gamma-glutamyl-phosphate reductase